MGSPIFLGREYREVHEISAKKTTVACSSVHPESMISGNESARVK